MRSGWGYHDRNEIYLYKRETKEIPSKRRRRTQTKEVACNFDTRPHCSVSQRPSIGTLVPRCYACPAFHVSMQPTDRTNMYPSGITRLPHPSRIMYGEAYRLARVSVRDSSLLPCLPGHGNGRLPSRRMPRRPSPPTTCPHIKMFAPASTQTNPLHFG